MRRKSTRKRGSSVKAGTDVFLLYEPDAEKLKQLALTLDVARSLPSVSGKPKLVFAPTKYLDPIFPRFAADHVPAVAISNLQGA